MAKVVFGNGANIVLLTPSLNGDNVFLAGTSAASEPFVFFADTSVFQFPTVPNVLNSVLVEGSAPSHEEFGMVLSAPSDVFGLTLSHGILLSYGNLFMGSGDGGATILDGSSWVVNDSTYTAWGGRYQLDSTVLMGNIMVGSGGLADFSHTLLRGSGNIFDIVGGTVDVNRVSANVHVEVLGGRLVTQPALSFLGTDHEANGGVTDILNSGSATLEVFNQTTGGLYLLDPSHTIIDKMIFVGDPTVFATPDGHGGMNITTDHHAGSLPAIFVH